MLRTAEFYRECGYEDVGYMPAPLTSEEEYPSYIEKAVKEAVKKIQDAQNEHTVTFAFMTDIHYALNHNHTVRFKRTMRAYREIAKRAEIDMLIMGGDYTNEGCKEYKMNAFRELRALIGEHDYFPVNGNHDDGSIWDESYIEADKATNHLTHTELYKLFYNHLPKHGAELDPKNPSLYYLYDDKNTKTRYIFLDSGDVPYMFDEKGKLKYPGQHLFAMSQEQIDWLTEHALKFDEEGWSVMLFTHSLLLPKDVESPQPIRENMEILRRILLSYKRGEDCRTEHGTGDFSRRVDSAFSKYKRAEIIGVFCGDYHYDEITHYEDIPIIITENAVMYDKGGRNRKRENATKGELLFDIVTVDKRERKISIVRIGAGEDRECVY